MEKWSLLPARATASVAPWPWNARRAARGAQLALSDIREEPLQETARLVEKLGGRAVIRLVDVAKREEVEAWAAAAAAELGGVDVIINNAGVALLDTLEDVPYEEFRWVFDILFWGVVHGTKAFLPHLLKNNDGHIVNISSIFGIIGVPTQSAYNASKFAVRGFTEALRQEVQCTQVNVSCVHPGGIKTNIARSARFYRDMSGNQDAARSAANFDKIAAPHQPKRPGSLSTASNATNRASSSALMHACSTVCNA